MDFFIIYIFYNILLFKKKSIYNNFFITAFLLRALLVILEQYGLIKLPDGNLINSDANYFEVIARDFSNSKGIYVVEDFFNSDSLLISRIISIFYTLFGESTMMAKSISVGLGTASVYMVYRICESIWDLKAAYKAAWFTTLFPTLILYSAITLREVYVVFFLLFSLMSIFKYIEKNLFCHFFIQ